MRRGEIYWFRFRGEGSEPRGLRPALVVQHDRFNRTGLGTTIVCAISSNTRLAAKPGNVALRRGEANLPRASVVNATQVVSVDRSLLGHLIGTIGRERMTEVLRGLMLILGPDEL